MSTLFDEYDSVPVSAQTIAEAEIVYLELKSRVKVANLMCDLIRKAIVSERLRDYQNDMKRLDELCHAHVAIKNIVEHVPWALAAAKDEVSGEMRVTEVVSRIEWRINQAAIQSVLFRDGKLAPELHALDRQIPMDVMTLSLMELKALKYHPVYDIVWLNRLYRDVNSCVIQQFIDYLKKRIVVMKYRLAHGPEPVYVM